MDTADLGAYADRTVGQVMVRSPKVLAADATVGAAREVLRDDHVHLVLLVDPGGRLVGTVVREDLSGAAGTAAAIGVASLRGRVVRPTSTVREVLPLLEGAVARRLAVVDGQGLLVGLLCLKRSQRGFCDDAGVVARAAERTRARLNPAR